MHLKKEKNIALLCNPLAGAGISVSVGERVSEMLKRKNICHSLFKETWPRHFSSFSAVFISGGDGTLNYFINHYPDVQLPLVIFKGGTGNDFHWLLYGNKTLEEQLEMVLTGIAKPVDIGKCNDQYFINGLGIGFEGAVAKALTGKIKRPGKTSFFFTVLKKIFTYRSKMYVITSAGKIQSGKKLLVDISNGSRAGGGFHIAPVAKADDGLFDIVIADGISSFHRLRHLPAIEKGKHLNLPFIQHFCTEKITVESNELMQYHLDGEYGEAGKLEIVMLPGQMNFIF